MWILSTICCTYLQLRYEPFIFNDEGEYWAVLYRAAAVSIIWPGLLMYWIFYGGILPSIRKSLVWLHKQILKGKGI